MPLLATIRRVLTGSLYEDLKNLDLDACEAQARREVEAMMCTLVTSTIHDHHLRKVYLRRRIRMLRAERGEPQVLDGAADAEIIALPPF